MKIAEVINASQFTLLSLLLAVVAYIRSVPVKDLQASKKKLEDEIEKKYRN